MTEKAKELGKEHLIYTEGYSLGGLRKREYFAGLAMQGYLSEGCIGGDTYYNVMATSCVRCADALLEQLSKEE
jgi:hypothetical protein